MAFDPSKPYEAAPEAQASGASGFDPDKPYESAPESSLGGAGGSWDAPKEDVSTKAKNIGEKVANAAVAPLVPEGRAEKEGREYAESAPTKKEAGIEPPSKLESGLEASGIPIISSLANPGTRGAVKRGIAGAYSDALGTARQMVTSPLGIATLGMSEVGEAIPKVASVVKPVGRAAGALFGAQGAHEAYEGAKDIEKQGLTPETAKRTLSGAAMVPFGAAGLAEGTDLGETPVNTVAGAKKIATAPIRMTAKGYNVARNAAPYAIPAISAVEGGIHGGPMGVLEGAAAGTYAGSRLKRILPEASETVGLPKEEANLIMQQKAVQPLRKAFDEAQKEYDSYNASKEANVPLPEEVVTKLEKSKAALMEGLKHLDLAEQASANAKAGRPNVPNDVASGLGKIKQAVTQPAAKTGEALAQPTTAMVRDKFPKSVWRPLGKATTEPEITPAEVKSSPGTSMSPEGKLPKPEVPLPARPAPKELGFDTSIKTGPDMGEKVRAEAPPLPRGERRAVPRTPEQEETQKLFGQARKELGEDATSDQVMARVDELKKQSKTETVGTPEGAKNDTDFFQKAKGELGSGASVSDNEEVKASPEDVQSTRNVLKDLADQALVKVGQKYDVDHSDYDFSKRDDNRHRVERDAYVNAVADKIPDEMKRKLIEAEEAFNDKDSPLFTDAERNSASKAAKAKAIWDAAHEPEESEGKKE